MTVDKAFGIVYVHIFGENSTVKWVMIMDLLEINQERILLQLLGQARLGP